MITKSEPLCRHERVFGKAQFKIFCIAQWDAEILYVPHRTGFSLNGPHFVGKARHNLRSSLVTDCTNSVKFPTIRVCQSHKIELIIGNVTSEDSTFKLLFLTSMNPVETQNENNLKQN